MWQLLLWAYYVRRTLSFSLPFSLMPLSPFPFSVFLHLPRLNSLICHRPPPPLSFLLFRKTRPPHHIETHTDMHTMPFPLADACLSLWAVCHHIFSWSGLPAAADAARATAALGRAQAQPAGAPAALRVGRPAYVRALRRPAVGGCYGDGDTPGRLSGRLGASIRRMTALGETVGNGARRRWRECRRDWEKGGPGEVVVGLGSQGTPFFFFGKMNFLYP